MAGSNENKGFLRSAWGLATSPVVTIPFSLFMAAFVGPLLFDMGTWLKPFHDLSNLRTQAWAMTVDPYLSWIPFHAGFTEPGGFFYDTMTAIIKPNLDILEAQRDAARAADSALMSLPTLTNDYNSSAAPLDDDPLADMSGLDLLSSSDPLSSGADLLSSDPLSSVMSMGLG